MTAATTDCIVQVFARAPTPGQVKTRLIPALGPAGAALLAGRLLDRTLETARLASLGPLELWRTPDAPDAAITVRASRFAASAHTQGEGDLGQRMARALAEALQRAPRVLLVGSDAPSLTPGDLRNAAGMLREPDGEMVFIPAADGGYVLVGARRGIAVPLARLFEGIAWGGPQVMLATRLRLARLGVAHLELPARWDVDRPEDLDRLRADARLAALLAGIA